MPTNTKTTKTNDPTIADAQASEAFDMIGVATDRGTGGIVDAYRQAGFSVQRMYEVVCQATGDAPLTLGHADLSWSLVSKRLPWVGEGTTRTVWGRPESTVQRAWKIAATHSPDAVDFPTYLSVCDAVSQLSGDENKSTREDPAYKRNLTGYVRWCTAASEGRILSDFSITSAGRTTGAAAGTRSAARADRERRVSEAATKVTGKSTAMIFGRITADQVRDLSDDDKRALRDLLTSLLATVKDESPAPVLAATAAADNTKGASKPRKRTAA